MAENIQKYGVKLDFVESLKGIEKLKKATASLNKVQEVALKRQLALQKKLNVVESGSSTKGRNQEDKDRIKVQKALTKTLAKEEAKRLQILDANIKKEYNARMSAEKQWADKRRESLSNLTSGGKSNSSKTAFAEMLAQEQKDFDIVEKARLVALDKQLKRQQDIEMAKARSAAKERIAAENLANREANLIKREAKRLETEKERIRNTQLMLKNNLTESEKIYVERVKIALEDSKSVKELKRAVAIQATILNEDKKRTKELTNQNFILQRMNSSSKQMAGNLVSAFAIAGAGTAVTQTGQQFEAVNSTLLSVTGSADKAAEELAFVKEEAMRLGAGFTQTTKSYAQLMAAGQGQVSQQTMRDTLTGIIEASTVLGLSVEDTTGSIKAVQQMLSKTKVSAEELRGQLGDRMPIAMKAMTAAAQKSNIITEDMVKQYGSAEAALSKLMEDGKLYTKDVLPAFSKELQKFAETGLEAKLESNTVAMKRLIAAFDITKNEIFQSGFGEGLTDLFNKLASFLKENSDLMKSFGKIAGSVFKSLAVIVDAITPLFKVIGSTLKTLTDALGDFSAVLLLAFSPTVVTTIASMATGLKGLRVVALGIMAPFAKLAAVISSIVFGIEELINLYTHEKRGILYDPLNPNRTIIENVMGKSFEKNSTEKSASDSLGMLLKYKADPIGAMKDMFSKMAENSAPTTPREMNAAERYLAESRNVPININTTIELDGEVVGQKVMSTSAAENAIKSTTKDLVSDNY